MPQSKSLFLILLASSCLDSQSRHLLIPKTAKITIAAASRDEKDPESGVLKMLGGKPSDNPSGK